MQTPRETIDSLMRREKCERVGLSDSPWGDTLRKWVTQGYPQNEEGKPVDPVEHFNFDITGMWGFEWIAKPGAKQVIEETGEWKIERDGNGAAFKWWKDKSGTPEHIDFLMTGREVWDRDYKPHVVASARNRVTAELVHKAKTDLDRKRAGNRSVRFGLRGLWENMRAAFGGVCLYETMLTDPGWVRDYCRTYTDLYREGSTIMFSEVGRPDAVWVYDDFGYSPTCRGRTPSARWGTRSSARRTLTGSPGRGPHSRVRIPPQGD